MEEEEAAEVCACDVCGGMGIAQYYHHSFQPLFLLFAWENLSVDCRLMIMEVVMWESCCKVKDNVYVTLLSDLTEVTYKRIRIERVGLYDL